MPSIVLLAVFFKTTTSGISCPKLRHLPSFLPVSTIGFARLYCQKRLLRRSRIAICVFSKIVLTLLPPMNMKRIWMQSEDFSPTSAPARILTLAGAEALHDKTYIAHIVNIELANSGGQLCL